MYCGTNRDVPAYTMMAGQPAAPHGINSEGLKRRGFSSEQIRNIRNAYRIVYRQGNKLAEAIQQVELLVPEQPDVVPSRHTVGEQPLFLPVHFSRYPFEQRDGAVEPRRVGRRDPRIALLVAAAAMVCVVGGLVLPIDGRVVST